MQSFFGTCIFCRDKLSRDEVKGRGDHVIPEFMYGSFCIKDVCTSCNNRLGHIADHLAIEDGRIISAVFKLDLPELKAKIRDRGQGKILDLTDGSESLVKFKDGKPWVVPRQVSEQMFVSDERDARAHLLNRLRKTTEHGLSEGERERIVHEELWPKYQALEPGESIHEPRLGFTLRKAPGKIVQDWKVTDGAAKRLVAKIGYEVAFLVFDRDRLAALPMLV